MNAKQNMLLYMGISCILAGIVFLLYFNGLLPKDHFYEYANVAIAIIFLILYGKTRTKITLMMAVFFFLNVSIMVAARLLNTESFFPRVALIPGIILLLLYITKRKSVILTIGSILTSWGFFLLLREPIGIQGHYFSVGALMLFTVLAFIFIWIIERQNWPALPILILGVIGTYLVADALGETVKSIVLQGGCVILILTGVVFVLRSLFSRHLEEE